MTSVTQWGRAFGMNWQDLTTAQSEQALWLMGGLMFLMLGMLVGEPSIAAIGLAALITAIAALNIPSVAVQLLLWSILSISLAVVMRGMVPKQSAELQSNIEAEVSDTIPQGGTGEVAYQGSLWKARCQVSDMAIATGQAVYVLGRQGNTLIVLPTNFSDEMISDRKR
ncbi:MAG: NfeD family protein [Elainellaceae cyanobacterium]